MLPFDQKTDMYRPLNRIKEVQEVDIIKTLGNFTVQDVVEKIQKVVKQKSLRINEFMKDFDPLRSGSITKYQFLSSLSMLKIFLSRKEAELLCDKYANPAGSVSVGGVLGESRKHVNAYLHLYFFLASVGFIVVNGFKYLI